MEQRQAAHHHVVGTEMQQRAGGDLGVAGQAGVGQLGALRLAGGAGGVQHDGGVVVGALDRFGLGGQVGEHRGQIGVVDDPGAGAGRFGGRASLVGEGGGREQRDRGRVGQVVQTIDEN